MVRTASLDHMHAPVARVRGGGKGRKGCWEDHICDPKEPVLQTMSLVISVFPLSLSVSL